MATTLAEWLARGVCPLGHVLFDALDLRRRGDGTVGCARCDSELSRERGYVLADLVTERTRLGSRPAQRRPA